MIRRNDLTWILVALVLVIVTACAPLSAAGPDTTGPVTPDATKVVSHVTTPTPPATDNPAATPTAAVKPAPTPTATVKPAATATQVPTPTPTVPAQVLVTQLGFVMPIKGAHVPEVLGLVPGARREYRTGFHEGVDFGYNAVGVPVRTGTPVLAVGEGTVVRADLEYREPTLAEKDQMLSRSRALGDTTPEDLDRLRGMQVWIDHGQGIVTRYCHLSRIAPGIVPGTRVSKGQLIAYVGTSGIAGERIGDDSHLHFEIRLGDTYLGQGLTPAKARELYVQVLSGKN